MSVVRGRPPGFAGGMNGSIRRYWSSLRAWPEPKSPTSARTSGVHIAASGKGVSPIRTAINITVHPRSNGGGCTFKTGSYLVKPSQLTRVLTGSAHRPEQLGEDLSPFCLVHAPGRQVGKQVDLGGAQMCIERAVIRKAVRRSLGFDDRPDRGVVGEQLSPGGDKAEIIPD